jgi:hypothetical protein
MDENRELGIALDLIRSIIDGVLQNAPDTTIVGKDGIVVATGVGEPSSTVRFADLTGDGKADYIIQYDGGTARGYRNNGIPRGSGRKWITKE